MDQGQKEPIRTTEKEGNYIKRLAPHLLKGLVGLVGGTALLAGGVIGLAYFSGYDKVEAEKKEARYERQCIRRASRKCIDFVIGEEVIGTYHTYKIGKVVREYLSHSLGQKESRWGGYVCDSKAMLCGETFGREEPITTDPRLTAGVSAVPPIMREREDVSYYGKMKRRIGGFIGLSNLPYAHFSAKHFQIPHKYAPVPCFTHDSLPFSYNIDQEGKSELSVRNSGAQTVRDVSYEGIHAGNVEALLKEGEAGDSSNSSWKDPSTIGIIRCDDILSKFRFVELKEGEKYSQSPIDMCVRDDSGHISLTEPWKNSYLCREP